MTAARFLAVVALLAFGTASPAAPNGGAWKREKARLAGVARAVSKSLGSQHVTQRAPDDEVSRRAWTNVIEECDADHCVFTAADIADFAKSRLSLDDALRRGDFAFALRVREVYRARLRERVAFATNLLARCDFEFGANDFCSSREGAPWPAEGAVRDALWTAKVKGEVLDELIDCETGGVRRAAAEVADAYREMLKSELKIKPAAVCASFIAAVASAYDAHTMYLPKTSYDMFKSQMDLALCGVGAEWTFKDGAAKIKRLIPGGPLAKDGRVKAGDVITGVAPDGKGKVVKLAGRSESDIVSLFRGKKGSKITLEVKHPDGKTGLYTLVRDDVPMDSERASSKVVEIDVAGRRLKAGYLRLPSFYSSLPGEGKVKRSCAEDLRKELRALGKAGVCGVLFDLRDNGGGALDDAVKVISLFVRGGPAVRMCGPGGDVTLPAPEDKVECEVPVVVLTSMGSASAGELVPATLQDLGRAVVAGDAHTFGKGSAQTVEELGEKNGALVVTNGRFYRVTGESTQFKGVECDVLLPSVNDEVSHKGEKGLRHPLPWDVVRGVSFKPSWDLRKFVPELRKAALARQAKSGAWRRHMELVRWSAERAAAAETPLGMAARREQMRRSDAVDDEIERLGDKGFDPERREDDAVLDEGLCVLADLVRLNGGRALPSAAAAQAESTLLGGLDDD